jgi:hypothetical protein
MKPPRVRTPGTRIAVALVGIILALGAILFCLPKRNRAVLAKVTILDTRLKIFWARALKGTNTYYLPAGGNVLGSEGLGSHLEGELRQEISRLGLKIETLPAFKGKDPSGRAFLVSYAFPDPPTSSVHLCAELAANNGARYPLRSVAGGGGGPPERSWDLWALDSLPSAAAGYTLRLAVQTNGPPVAEIKFTEP